MSAFQKIGTKVLESGVYTPVYSYINPPSNNGGFIFDYDEEDIEHIPIGDNIICNMIKGKKLPPRRDWKKFNGYIKKKKK